MPAPTAPSKPARVTDLIYLRRAAVFGSGAFGTALATVLAKKCKDVRVWHMNAKEADLINEKHENVLFLKGAPLPHNITYSADVNYTYENAEIILFVIPTQFLRGFLSKHGKALCEYATKTKARLLVCSKGIERSTLKFPAEIVAEFFPGMSISVLAGPSFAIEVATSLLTQVCVADENIHEARTLQRILTTPDRLFRCWATTDTVGCEVASAVKNVLAIGSGMSTGLGMGLDARAALIARGLLEIRDLTKALGGNGEAIFGLAGAGDLILTCSSELSRNFSVGKKLGEGQSMEEIQRAAKAVAEGVATSDPLFRLAAQKKVSMPLCAEVYRAIYEKKPAKKCMEDLLKTPLRDEGLPALYQAKTMRARL